MALRNFDVFWLDLDVFLFQSPTAAVAKVTAAVANVELLISGAFAATLLYQLVSGKTLVLWVILEFYIGFLATAAILEFETDHCKDPYSPSSLEIAP